MRLSSCAIKMNPMETTIETSKRKHEIHSMSAGVSQLYNSSALIRDQMNAPSLYTDRAMIKYVIGASNISEQQSILKKSANNQIPTVASPTATILASNSIAKLVAKSVSDASVAVKLQQSKAPAQSESKQQTAGQSLIKLPIIKNPEGSAERTIFKSFVRRSVPPHKQLPGPKALRMPTAPHGHIIYKGKNANSPTLYPEMIASSLLPRSADISSRKLPTIKDVPRTSMNPVILNRQNSESPEVTQISSTVTLTKAPLATTGKQAKSLPSPIITIEKKGNTPTASLFNCSKQGKILFPNSAEPMDIVVNTIGGSKMISLGNDEDEPEPPQKSLLKQSSPTSSEKTPPKHPKQQSLLKVNSLARLLHTSPRTKRSKSLTAISAKITKRKRPPPKGSRRLSTASDGEVLLQMHQLITDSAEHKENVTASSPPVQKTDASLLCNERIETIPSSSSSNNSSLEITPQKEPGSTIDTAYVHSFQLNTVLDMLSAFKMLSWKDRIGSCKDSQIKFHLNEFNLLQVAERCPPRDRIHTAYEKPIFERESSSKTSDYTDPLYLCRRCNCRGAAIDFLAPEFCSYECFRRDVRKRPKTTPTGIGKERFKKARKSLGSASVESADANRECMSSKRPFTWASYLSTSRAEAAPIDLFLNPFPCEANLFEIGMKLEAIDPEHNSLFCVCTVVEKKGYRLKLQFDGYSKIHNFWVNCDSMDIFPPGWCAKTNRILQPPKGMNLLTFNWPAYLTKTKSTPAPRSLFTHLNSSSSTNPFKVGMRLEADDLKNTGKVCVASVADVLDNRVLVHFDGWDESYDYWIDINSPYIHPIDWHQGKSLELVPPPDWEDFSWQEYLEFTRSKPAQPRMFSRRCPIEFCTGMKLEVVDVKNACLIRPATVLCRSEYKILIHLVGWPNEFTFWVNDDSPDIHPIGWSEETGHDLEPPPPYEPAPANMPCPVKGCRGIGNARRIDITFHANEDTCPYTLKNWELEIEKPSRLDEAGRFVCTNDASTTQRQSNSESNIIDLSSDDQATDVKIESDIKPLPISKQKLQLVKSKSIAAPSTTESKPHLNSSTDEIKLAREYLCDYGPRLKQNYMIWCENSNFNSDAIKKNPLEWTTKETADYITAKCHPIGYIFVREDINGLALLSMHQSDLTDILKIKLGPAIKIFSHILHLRNQVISRFNATKPSTDT